MTRLRFLDAPPHVVRGDAIRGLWTALLIVFTAFTAVLVVPATIEMRRATVALQNARETIGDLEAAKQEAAAFRADIRRQGTAVTIKAAKEKNP